ncbi:MAG: hydroxyisourate hydrolase [Rhodobacteraceae bacterium]|nr:hydroxyisourate hydrolase [Paracoccaceae bacterium]
MGRLTTHVLDTALGRPAAGMEITLKRANGDVIKTVRTNDDGRVDAPLLEGAALIKGGYELTFNAGAYLDATGQAGAEPRFLDEIPIRFGVADPEAHYHVPLLLSPFGYSTYRGS